MLDPRVHKLLFVYNDEGEVEADNPLYMNNSPMYDTNLFDTQGTFSTK